MIAAETDLERVAREDKEVLRKEKWQVLKCKKEQKQRDAEIQRGFGLDRGD